MKKLLLIMCVCAILLSGTACKKTQNTTNPDDTTNVNVSETVSDETKDNEETKADTEDTEKADDETTAEEQQGDETVPADSTPSDSTPADTTPADTTPADTTPEETAPVDTTPLDTTEDVEPVDPDDEPDTPVINEADETMLNEVISKGGKEDGLWPSEEVPEDVPAFEDYSEMYQATHTEGESSDEWYLSFDSTEKDYEDWLDKLAQEGYTESDKIVGFWGNGNQILNLYTEEVDGEFCVSIDIFKSDPVVYPDAVSKVFPEFTHTDSTLYGWYVKEGTPNVLSVSYACGQSFDQDLTAYKNKLTEAGFNVTDDSATKEVDGKTYTVRYGDSISAYEDCLEFEY